MMSACLTRALPPDHIDAILQNPALTTYGFGNTPTPISFVTSGSAGVSECAWPALLPSPACPFPRARSA